MRRVQSNTLDVGIDVHLKNWSTAILSKHSVLRRFLQVDCEGPTLISYIVAKHLAHASRGTISPPYVPFGIRRFLFWAPFEIAVHELHIACLTQFIIGHYKGYYWAVRDTPIT